MIILALLRRLARHTMQRPPDFIVGGHFTPYLRRWYIIPRNPLLNIYLHEFLRSDDDRALHDHPWVNGSILIHGAYIEHTIAAGGIHHRRARGAGDVVLRTPRAAHRVEIIPGIRCHTFFITGPRIRNWGFHCPRG